MATRTRYTPTYQSWQAMRQRCDNPKHSYFENYGGRGIQVDPRWDDFATFLLDMGERPPGTSLDRRKNELGYSRANCRWSTRTEQNRNNAQNRVVIFAGQQRCLGEWCELLGLNYPRVYARLFRLNWTPEHAFTR